MGGLAYWTTGVVVTVPITPNVIVAVVSNVAVTSTVDVYSTSEVRVVVTRTFRCVYIRLRGVSSYLNLWFSLYRSDSW